MGERVSVYGALLKEDQKPSKCGPMDTTKKTDIGTNKLLANGFKWRVRKKVRKMNKKVGSATVSERAKRNGRRSR